MLNLRDIFKKKHFRCFEADYGHLQIASRSYKGVKAIPVSKVIGTVSRCQDDKYWNKVKRTSTKFQQIKDALQDATVHMPAISVYKVKDEYYLIDGHHRVLASREVDRAFIDAEVIEYYFSDRVKQDFQHRCGSGKCPGEDSDDNNGLGSVIKTITEKADYWYNKQFTPFLLNQNEIDGRFEVDYNYITGLNIDSNEGKNNEDTNGGG